MRRATVHLPGWPAGARPLRVALLSDIHLGNHAMDSARLAGIVAQVNAARPDLILIAGDFVTGHDSSGIVPRAAALTAPLSALRAPLGTIAVLGNHDYWTDPKVVREALERAGIVVLENRSLRRGPVVVLGPGDAFSGHADIAATLVEAKRLGGIPVVLSHTPDVAHELPAGVPLVLAGHTHCGQIALPLIGALTRYSPREERSLYDPRYRCGPIRDPSRLVVVTAGLGAGSIPIRLGTPPDWWLLTIQP